MQKIDTYNFSGKKAIIRVDFNVPLNEKYEVTEDTRIREAVPTIRKVIEGGGIAILMSHLGRPKGGYEEKYSLKHIVGKVSELLGKDVKFAPDCIGPEVEKIVSQLKPGDVLLLENLRFYKEEEKGDEEFAGKLAKLADCYINDAFGTAHRAHASTTIIAKFFPNDKMFGYIMEKEISSLDRVLNNIERPFTAIIGGAKVSTKITIIENLLTKVDNLIIGGAMAFTFVKANGGKVGSSLVEDDFVPKVADLYELAKKHNAKIILPVDSINADKIAEDASVSSSSIDAIPEGMMGVDIGPKSVEEFRKIIMASKTILWNGPVGVFEIDKFAEGTKGVCQAVADATAKGAFSLVGGGDSVAALAKFGMNDKVSYVSTGGGAMLEYVEGKILPGIEAIMK